MSAARRAEPLRAERPPSDRQAGTGAADSNGHANGRFQRLAEGVRRIRTGGGAFNERTLMILGGILAPVGLVVIVLGWYGAAHTPYVFEQVPYLVSGGLLGLGLVFLGSIFYFAHWLTELVKEHRAQSTALLEAIARLEETVRSAGATSASADGRVAASPPAATVPLVATPRGTMAHRPDCVVVAGKSDLRPVDADDGLLPCKLCDPYAIETAHSGT